MAKRDKEWPPWWAWELFMTTHVGERMLERGFTEIELRRIMEHATGYHRSQEEGRWVIETRRERRRWEVVVEPRPDKEVLEIVTAYAVKRKGSHE